MSHIESYRQNEDYAAFLANWDPAFYGKYVDSLATAKDKQRVLDVGCGVGQVVQQLQNRGLNAQGVDVSEPNVREANRRAGRCALYDGKRLPFADGHFHAVGAFNVLEHVEEPEDFIRELARVLSPSGRLVISSPNFLRVIGWRDYHPRMRGFENKVKNARRLLAIRRQIKQNPNGVRFERMPPIVKEPFAPDDDAVVATNPLHMKFFVEQNGCRVDVLECTDRHVPRPIHWFLNLPCLRYLWFNSFLVATKTNAFPYSKSGASSGKESAKREPQ